MEGMELTWACKIENYLGEHNGESQAEESRSRHAWAPLGLSGLSASLPVGS